MFRPVKCSSPFRCRVGFSSLTCTKNDRSRSPSGLQQSIWIIIYAPFIQWLTLRSQSRLDIGMASYIFFARLGAKADSTSEWRATFSSLRYIEKRFGQLNVARHSVGRKQAEPTPPVVAKGSIPFIYHHEKFLSMGDPKMFTQALQPC